jgi:crossover junction endodeoxyribonuclease RuvC
MAAALVREIPIVEYAPSKVKQSVTGSGNASKEQVAAMLKSMFKFTETPAFLDATDALAVAVCHHFQGGVAPTTKGAKTWGAFLADNPDRIK